MKPRILLQNRWILEKIAYRIASLKSYPANSGSLLRDTGILQPIISYPAEYGGESVDTVLINGLMNVVPIPNYIIVVSVSLDTAFTRYEKRQKATSRRENFSASRDGFQKAIQVQECIVGELQKQNIKIININMNDGVSETALRALATALKQ